MTPEIDPAAFALFQKHGAECSLDTWAALEEHFAAHGFSSTHVSEPVLWEQIHVHLKVHICPPSDAHPFVTLFTSGMSDKAQPVPAEREDCRFSELMMMLPPTWPGMFDEVQASVEPGENPPEYNWVMHWLLNIGRYPHITGNWLGPGHLIPTGDAEPLPGTGFTAFVLLEPISIPWEVRGRDGRQIALHTLVPLYPEEVDLKRKEGTEELLQRFAAKGLGEVVDPSRLNIAGGSGAPRKSWWPFRK
jgi:Suppressor of fused protein (SUFU)